MDVRSVWLAIDTAVSVAFAGAFIGVIVWAVVELSRLKGGQE